MKICTKCGMELNDDSRYCKSCGSGAGGREDAALQQEKKARVLGAERKGPRTLVIVGIAAAVVLSGWAGYAIMRGGPSSSRMSMRMAADGVKGTVTPIQALGPTKGEVQIPLAALQDGKAHFYALGTGERAVRFFALRKSDGSIGVALDACNACYRAKLGYRQDKDHVICNNCGMAFRPEDIGIVTGGCNPIPLVHTVIGDAVVVKAKELEQGRKYF